jgi:hypothetical protein
VWAVGGRIMRDAELISTHRIVSGYADDTKTMTAGRDVVISFDLNGVF